MLPETSTTTYDSIITHTGPRHSLHFLTEFYADFVQRCLTVDPRLLFVPQRRVPVENPFVARPEVAEPSIVPEVGHVSADFSKLCVKITHNHIINLLVGNINKT